MIIAIPLTRGQLANHFTKAKQIGFYDETGRELAIFDNPALGGSCKDKKSMRDLIVQQGTEVVIVQQIGERMLGKLLDLGLVVSRGESQQSIDCLVGLAGLNHHRLTQASQGRASLQHANKGGCCGDKGKDGGGCCGHNHDHSHGSDNASKVKAGHGCSATRSCCGKPKLVARADNDSKSQAVYKGFRPA